MLSSDLSCLNRPENEKKSECLCTTDVFPFLCAGRSIEPRLWFNGGGKIPVKMHHTTNATAPRPTLSIFLPFCNSCELHFELNSLITDISISSNCSTFAL